MPGRSYSATNQYRYGFNGKENDKDISEGGQDYGMRIYESRLGRFLSVDPITAKYPELTPYQFASNRPVDGTDLDGLEYRAAGRYGPNQTAVDATALTKYSQHPQEVETANQAAFSVASIAKMSIRVIVNPVVQQSSIGSKPYMNYIQEKWNNQYKEDALNEAGYNSDGRPKFLTALAVNKTWTRFANNLALPITEMAVGEGLGKLFVKGLGFFKKSMPSQTSAGPLVSLTEETFTQALYKAPEKIGAYKIYGTKGLVGNTFNRNIFLLETANSTKSLASFRALVQGMESEALKVGAKKISIFGSSIINKGFLNPQIAARFGYSFEQVGSGVILQKILKP